MIAVGVTDEELATAINLVIEQCGGLSVVSAKDNRAEVLPLPQPVRLMGLTLSALEGERDPGQEPPDGQLSLL